MKPIGPLMREHRLIERMVNLVAAEAEKARETKRVDVGFVAEVIDFFRTYADRTHHGKEEDILFRDLSPKQLPAELRQTMLTLIEEHRFARELVRSLASTTEVYAQGNSDSLPDIIGAIQKLVELYPAHIRTEDRAFFYPIMEFFSREEQEKMLIEFAEFDRRMIHEKYEKMVEGWQALSSRRSG